MYTRTRWRLSSKSRTKRSFNLCRHQSPSGTQDEHEGEDEGEDEDVK